MTISKKPHDFPVTDKGYCPQHGYPVPCYKCGYSPVTPPAELLTDEIVAEIITKYNDKPVEKWLERVKYSPWIKELLETQYNLTVTAWKKAQQGKDEVLESKEYKYTERDKSINWDASETELRQESVTPPAELLTDEQKSMRSKIIVLLKQMGLQIQRGESAEIYYYADQIIPLAFAAGEKAHEQEIIELQADIRRFKQQLQDLSDGTITFGDIGLYKDSEER